MASIENAYSHAFMKLFKPRVRILWLSVNLLWVDYPTHLNWNSKVGYLNFYSQSLTRNDSIIIHVLNVKDELQTNAWSFKLDVIVDSI